MSSEYVKFNSRRSTVYSTRGMVASSQPLANSAGLSVLAKGGNCVDACVAVSAALCVVEPASTGIGGDCFALYYRNSTKEVLGLNGSGRATKNLTLDELREHLGEDARRIPYTSVFAIIVPGAIAGWFDAYKKWGSGNLTFEELLEPAIQIAENGFAVAEIAARSWRACASLLKSQNPHLSPEKNPLLVRGQGPDEGDFVTNKPIAEALRLVGKEGKSAYYNGPVAEAIVRQTSKRGHKLALQDLASHTSTEVKPISIDFQNWKVWEIPPNGQGLVALVALGIIQELHEAGVIDLYSLKHNSGEYLHLLIEACKLGFLEGNQNITDPDFKDIPVGTILSKEYLRERAKLFRKNGILSGHDLAPNPSFKSDTVYFTVADSNGDACSFINSVYEGFGSAIVVPEYGFCLHNRGANFNLAKGVNNCFEPGKRPYHTIIPSLITNKDGSLFASFGNMGGFMQPLGHVQHVLNLCVFNFTAQQTIDSPRFCLQPNPNYEDNGQGTDGPLRTSHPLVSLEEGIDRDVVEELRKLGHTVEVVTGYDRTLFGRAQVIKNESKDGQIIYAGGSDLRGDGAAAAMF